MRNRTIKKSFYLNEEENRLLKEKCFGGLISESGSMSSFWTLFLRIFLFS